MEELRLFGKHERIDERIAHYLQAGTVPQLYEKILGRWEADYAGDTGLVGNALTLLWAARCGLTETELLDALGQKGDPLPRALWSPLFLAAGDSLVSRGGLLSFFHDYLREAVKNAYLPTEEQQRAAHLRLADYFALQPKVRPARSSWAKFRSWFAGNREALEPQPASPRQLDELPWQLAAATAWPQLNAILSDFSFFDSLWRASQNLTKFCWARLEENSFLMVDAYRPVLVRPDRFDSGAVWNLSFLLGGGGHSGEALKLRAHLAEYFRRTGDRVTLAACLCNQAEILRSCGDLDGAMALHKQEEQICRELGNIDDLGTCLGNQGLVLKAWGDLDGAMKMYKRAEQISRELGNKDGLQQTLGNQAGILKHLGDLHGAMALHKQEERICRELGNKDGLQGSLGEQALILRAHGDLDEAMALLKQKEQICRELGTVESLAVTLANQASLLAYKMARPHEALPLAEMAYRLMNDHGLTDRANELLPFLNDLRSLVRIM